MTATVQDIRVWVNTGVNKGATHVIIALDTWAHDNYPIYVMPTDDVHDIVASYGGKEDRIDEVYNLSMDIESQLKSPRVYNL